MANQQETRQDITAKVLKATKAEGKNGPYWEFDLVEAGQGRAFTWRMFDAKAGEAIAVGSTYHFTAGTKPTDRGGIFRNLYKAEPVEQPPTPPISPLRPSTTIYEADQEAKQRSIERQKASDIGQRNAQLLLDLFFRVRKDGEDWPSFRDTWAPQLEELTARFALRLYKGIHGGLHSTDQKEPA